MVDPDRGEPAAGVRPLRRDGAAPHQAPAPARMPRWLAWVVLVALAASGVVCVRAVVGG
jgi:hypothetical protein